MAEDEKERLDRELIELLNELRVIVTGVQMLFAFLLTVAFSQRFVAVTSLDRYVYFATVLSTALSSVWLIAPAAYHRLLFRYHEKQHMLVVANRMAITGMTFLALSITGVLFLITDVLFGGAATVVVTVLTVLLVVGLWFVWPLTRRGERLSPFADS
jgi:Family of unknown function (DUF6328)